MIEFVEIGEDKLRLFDSFRHDRLVEEGETLDEYKVRRQALNNFYEERKKGRTIHTSSIMIPLMDKSGELILDRRGKPIFTGKTKGTTYTKGLEKEHKTIVEHLEKLKDEQQQKEESGNETK